MRLQQTESGSEPVVSSKCRSGCSKANTKHHYLSSPVPADSVPAKDTAGFCHCNKRGRQARPG